MYGLFHDPARDEYKVVMCSNYSSSFFVLSLRDGSFKSKTMSHKVERIISGSEAIIVGGIPHWAGVLGFSDAVLIYLDRISEELIMVRFPVWRLVLGAGGWDGVHLQLGALDGQLTATVNDHFSDIEVWTLKDSEWSILFVMPDFLIGPVRILSRVSDDEILIYAECLTVYNVTDRSWRHLLSWEEQHEIVTYVPSLVSPNH